MSETLEHTFLFAFASVEQQLKAFSVIGFSQWFKLVYLLNECGIYEFQLLPGCMQMLMNPLSEAGTL